jgi:hypothetical protein
MAYEVQKGKGLISGFTPKEQRKYGRYFVYLPKGLLILSQVGQVKYGDKRWIKNKKGEYNDIRSPLHN